MREILFRGKTKEGKEWVEGFFAVFASTPFIGAPNSYGTMLWFEVIPDTVGEFSDLTDKNGKRIFEGDVLRISGWQWQKEWVAAVYCGDGAFNYRDRDEKYDVAISDSEHYLSTTEETEVIGNIHDNPELMEVLT